jgi:Mrp family chromosome partitioning ATPase
MPDPVVTVEVRWEPPADAATGASGPIPLPAQLRGAAGQSLFAFFGRAAELARLETALKETTGDRQARAVLIGGEPGVGKTTLAAQHARSAHASGADVVYGGCTEAVSGRRGHRGCPPSR